MIRFCPETFWENVYENTYETTYENTYGSVWKELLLFSVIQDKMIL